MPETHRHHLAPQGTPHVASGTTEPSSHDAEILAGTPYKVLARIGAGGQGTILDAEHRALGKRVVVKLLRAEHAKEPSLVARLKREARILARIASPYIVTVSDLGETADGSTFIAMERLFGGTLGDEVRARRALPVVEAIHWTREILAGLAAAHAASVVHRDIKLDNIFLCDGTDHEPRRIKLLDFGIAKVLNAATAGMDPSRHHPTAEGTLIGSPRWLAPEQARGNPVDGRTDIYAVGLVLYTLVAGRGPFSHIVNAIEALGASLIEQPPPPSTYAPQDIPAALDDAILMALDKDPEHRFQSAEAFSTALESIARGLEDVTQPFPATFIWRRFDTPSRTDQPKPEARAEDTPGTLLGKVAGAAKAGSSDATRVERAELAPSGAGHGAEPAEEEERVGVGRFIAVVAASALFFSAVLALVVHIVGSW
jgi:eukaryotic-like serine/threonine-protein kinase